MDVDELTRKIKTTDKFPHVDEFPYDAIKQLLDAGEPRPLIELARYFSQEMLLIPAEEWYYAHSCSCFETMIDALFYSRIHLSAEELHTIITLLPFEKFRREWQWCWPHKLAITQPPALLNELAPLLDQSYSEFVIQMVHEMVIRRIDVSPYPNLTIISQWTSQQKHPLAKLPLNLLPVERTIRWNTARYFLGRLGLSTESDEEFFTLPPDYPISPDVPEKLTASAANLPDVTWEETTTPELQKRIESAVQNWSRNGYSEVRQFYLHSPLSEDSQIPILLQMLNLECVNGVTVDELSLTPQLPYEIFVALFCAARGGPYDSGLENPFRRLRAWESIAALVNQPEQASIETLHEAMQGYSWFELRSPVWFLNYAWDIGIVALSHDRQTLSVLAATDVD